MPAPLTLWFSFGPFQLDIRNGQLYRGRTAVKLRPKTLAVLLYLAQRAGDVVTRADIIKSVWPDVIVQDDVLAVSLSELRRALGEKASHPRFIETVHARGVRFIADVVVSHRVGARADNDALQHAPLFVGREQYLSDLARMLENASRGTTHVAVICGPAGIGKTSLLRRFAELASARGAQVLRANAEDASQHATYWMWTQLLRDFAASCSAAELRSTLGAAAGDIAVFDPALQGPLAGIEAPPPMEAEIARARFFDGMTAFVHKASQRAPLVLMLDDLHKATQGSLALLQTVLAELRNQRLFVLMAHRQGERNPALQQLIESTQKDDSASLLELPPLNEGEIRTLIANASMSPPSAALVDRIAEYTQGNPYFLLEILASLGEPASNAPPQAFETFELPATVRRVIENRLRQVSDPARRFLRAAAVAGNELDARVAARAAELSPLDASRVVSETLAAGFLVEAELSVERLHFRHELLRDTLLQGTTRFERAHLHEQIGRTIEELSSNPASVATQLVYHFARGATGASTTKAITNSLLAGRQALARYDNDEAAELLRQALELSERIGATTGRELCEILESLAEAYVRQGRFDESEAVADRLRVLANANAHAEWRAKAAIAIARNYLPACLRVADKPVLMLEEALTGLGSEPTPLRDLTRALLAQSLLGRKDADERRIEIARSVVARARSADDAFHQLVLWHEIMLAFWDPDHLAERTQLAEEFEQACRAAHDEHQLTASLSWQALNLVAVGRFTEAEALMRRTDDLVKSYMRPKVDRYNIRLRANIAVLRGHFDAAVGLLAKLPQRAPHLDRISLQFEPLLIHLAIAREQGRMGDMTALLRDLASQYPLLPLSCALPYFLMEGGEIDEARAGFAILTANDFADLPPRNETVCWLITVAGLADVCAELEAHQPAARLYRLLEPYSGQWALVHFGLFIGGAVARLLGRLAALGGDIERAESHFNEAIAACRREGVVTELARTQLHYAHAIELQQRRGNDKSRQLRAAALALAHTHGLEGIRRRAEK